MCKAPCGHSGNAMNYTLLTFKNFQFRKERKQVHKKHQCKAEFIFFLSFGFFFFFFNLLLSIDNRVVVYVFVFDVLILLANPTFEGLRFCFRELETGESLNNSMLMFSRGSLP